MRYHGVRACLKSAIYSSDQCWTSRMFLEHVTCHHKTSGLRVKFDTPDNNCSREEQTPIAPNARWRRRSRGASSIKLTSSFVRILVKEDSKNYAFALRSFTCAQRNSRWNEEGNSSDGSTMTSFSSNKLEGSGLPAGGDTKTENMKI